VTLENIGFNEAFQLTMAHALTAGTEVISILNSSGLVVAKDIMSVVDSPSVDASLKDGYAVISDDISKASKDNPIKLKMIDSVAAGDNCQRILKPGGSDSHSDRCPFAGRDAGCFN